MLVYNSDVAYCYKIFNSILFWLIRFSSDVPDTRNLTPDT